MIRTFVLRGLVVPRPMQRNALTTGVRAMVTQGSKKHVTLSFQHQKQMRKLEIIQRQSRRYFASDMPAHTKVVLPALSPTMEEGTLISWAKKEGDKLNEGDLLAEIETDKATMAFETPEEGYLAKILVPAGTKGVPIGKLVCIIVEKEADVAAFKDFKDDSPTPAKAAAIAGVPAEQPPPAAASTSPKPQAQPPQPAEEKQPPPVQETPHAGDQAGGRIYASPMAKRLAEQRKIRLQGKGSGLFGSITSADLDSQPAQGQAPSKPPQFEAGPNPYIDHLTSNMRTTIAKRLAQSKSTIPHFYVATEVCLDTINSVRKKINKQMEDEGVRLSINDFIIKAAAMANLSVPEANSYWMDSSIRQFMNVDVSVAVATETGLITPIVFNANNKGIIAISREVKQLAKKARAGKLQPQEYQGGTITISNLGMFDVNFFTAIINPPQSIILAVGSGKEKLVLDEKSEKGYKTSTTMLVTLSCDHRVVDGVVGARWLKAFRRNIEDPITMVL